LGLFYGFAYRRKQFLYSFYGFAYRRKQFLCSFYGFAYRRKQFLGSFCGFAARRRDAGRHVEVVMSSEVETSVVLVPHLSRALRLPAVSSTPRPSGAEPAPSAVEGGGMTALFCLLHYFTHLICSPRFTRLVLMCIP
jgi:hypothetical protein